MESYRCMAEKISMGKKEKVLESARTNPAGLRFSELCSLVERAGFVRRHQKGSHLVYTHPKLKHLRPLPLQEGKSGMAKPYQVRQFVAIMDTYELEVE